jgi:hypothetical protein
VVDSFWGSGKGELTGRMSSMVRCGRPEGNNGGGGARGWWSTARGVGRLYTAARCSGHGRNGRREAGAGCLRWLSGGGNNGAVGGKKRRRKKGCSTVGRWAPFIAGRGGGRRAARR